MPQSRDLASASPKQTDADRRRQERANGRLSMAAFKCDAAGIRRALKSGADPAWADPDFTHRTAFELIVFRADFSPASLLECAQILAPISDLAPLFSKDETLEQVALCNDFSAVLFFLNLRLSWPSAEPEATRAFNQAASRGKIESMRALLDAANPADILWDEAFVCAFLSDRDDFLRSLLSRSPSNRPPNLVAGEPPLLAASFFGATKCLQILLDGSFDPAQVDDEGNTALMRAVRHPDCVRELLPVSNFAARDSVGRTALMMAAESDESGCFESLKLLAPFSDIHATCASGITALMRAASAFNVDGVRLLLSASNVQAQQPSTGYCALHFAIDAGCAEVVSLLAPRTDLAALADPAPNPVELAIGLKAWDCLDALLLVLPDASFGLHLRRFVSSLLPMSARRMEAVDLAAEATVGQKKSQEAPLAKGLDDSSSSSPMAPLRSTGRPSPRL